MSVIVYLVYLTGRIASNLNESVRLNPEKWKGIGTSKLKPKKLTNDEKQDAISKSNEQLKSM